MVWNIEQLNTYSRQSDGALLPSPQKLWEKSKSPSKLRVHFRYPTKAFAEYALKLKDMEGYKRYIDSSLSEEEKGYRIVEEIGVAPPNTEETL